MLTLGCLPVAVLGIAYVVAWAGIPLGLSMLLVALTLMTASGVIAVVGWRRLKTAAGPLQRSRRELQKNLDWFKRTLANDRGSETKRFDRAAANLINSEPHQ